MTITEQDVDTIISRVVETEPKRIGSKNSGYIIYSLLHARKHDNPEFEPLFGSNAGFFSALSIPEGSSEEEQAEERTNAYQNLREFILKQ